jgi:signal recognition particle receptor subunit beta
MVFFNYATMQMAAKIVYYGPGLCGKTTNLHYIYGRTSPSSRGEMVSLETETDRTLFFDLLPLDVGVIGGFKTRVQLYTVPGQVFYNTTRKLVLKGVDGIVFVADSQRAMKDANVESLGNLRSNLAEIGVKLEELPLVLQYNKRDLGNVLALDELEETLNPARQYESYEACAVMGQGVFETLKAISKITLRSLKKRMLGEERPPRPTPTYVAPAPAVAPSPPAAAPPAPPVIEPEPPPPESIAVDLSELGGVTAAEAAHRPEETVAFTPSEASPPPPPELLSPEEFDASDVETVQEFEEALNSLDSPLPETVHMESGAAAEEAEIEEVEFAEAAQAEEVKPDAVKHVKVRSNIDILAELEKLRKNATSAPVVERPTKRPAPGVSIDDLLASSLNHRKEINRIFEVQVPQRELSRGHQVTVGLRIEDRQKNLIGEEKSFSIELQTKRDIEKLLLSLKFHIFGK